MTPARLLPLVLLGVAGLLIGALTRLVLRRLRRPILLRTGWCEGGTALVLFGLGMLGVQCGVGWQALLIPMAIALFGVPLVCADLLCCRLPNALTTAGYPLVALAVFGQVLRTGDTAMAWRALLGALLFGLGYAVSWWLRPDALGAGDVKLVGSLGAALGAVSLLAVPVCALFAALCTAVSALASPRRRVGVPHAPGLVLGALLITALSGGGIG
ncbi:MAG: prepilin peptidase [Sciscionella sp.]